MYILFQQIGECCSSPENVVEEKSCIATSDKKNNLLSEEDWIKLLIEDYEKDPDMIFS